MAEQVAARAAELLDQAAIARAHELAASDTLLEHARMGRTVSEWRDGQIVTVTPEEIFARYGLDANGKPVTS
jgi:hypothetical protein